MRLLIVRMSALGDIVHALPVLAAIRAAWPHAEIDWLADRAYAGVLEHVDGIEQRIIGRPEIVRAIPALRGRRYDAALDLQGLLKSAVMARLSGAARVVGFEPAGLREPAAAWFYDRRVPVDTTAHIVRKNLSVLSALGLPIPDTPRFPLVVPASPIADAAAGEAVSDGAGRFAIVNPGAAWPNKRWPPDRFGAVARHLRDRHGVGALVIWGRGEDGLADAVVAASGGAAVRAPATALGDLIALCARATLMISGDTGPLHIAAALGTPIVGLYGPTFPERNGPWRPDDVTVSRAESCACHHKRSCRRASRCLDDITVDEVRAAVDLRLARIQEAR
jgi:lipopolysaccharide heptosyltransferase I